MRTRTVGIVVTTISEGGFLDAYARTMRQPPAEHSVRLYVVGDVNTSPACRARAEALAAEGVDMRYLDLDAQETFLRPFPELLRSIPLRSDGRRNVGYLQAFADRCDVVISVDDDNVPVDGASFLAEHANAGCDVALPTTQSENGWFNLGTLLSTKDAAGTPLRIYPRGFPYGRRFSDGSGVSGPVERGRVGINAGMWSGDPDVDAATRLVTGVVARPGEVSAVLFARGHRSPINSQNTALAWHAIPSYWFVAMGAVLDGVAIGRFGDIFSGYFAQLCAEAVGHRVRAGGPWVHQDRNPHDLLSDLWCEMPGMRLVEDMTPLLSEPLPRAPSYAAAYRELAERLVRFAEGRQGAIWKPETRAWFARTAQLMNLWCDACETLAGGERELAVD
jgi:hypothetical protein